VRVLHATVWVDHGTVWVLHATVWVDHGTVCVDHGTVCVDHGTVCVDHGTVWVLHATGLRPAPAADRTRRWTAGTTLGTISVVSVISEPMPIPKALPIGILPPFLKTPSRRDSVSPYPATPAELVDRYASSPRRIRILEGLLAYRGELRRVGLSVGFQWIDGSLVETLNPAPNDVDVVTVSSLPVSCRPEDEHLFSAVEAKRRFLCDAYFVDLANREATWAVTESVYWYGLLSHQRRTQRWKGMVQLDLASPDDDRAARDRIEALKRGAP
jgi:hypothetical protein